MLLHDDNNLTGHSLQVMSYFLCHTYARCTRTVAMPVAIYYAQLVAMRARYWLRHAGYVDDSMSTISNDSAEDDKFNTAQRTIQSVNANLSHRMFFC